MSSSSRIRVRPPLIVAAAVIVIGIAAFATAASAWNNSAAGTTISSVKINGGGSQATVAAGSTVSVSFNYSIADPGCPGCYDQIEVGWNHESGPTECVYDDQPGAAGVSGTASYSLTAPNTAGVYYLAYDEGSDYYCNATSSAWWNGTPPDPNTRIIGRVVVGSNVAKYQDASVKISGVHLNGKGNDVTVKHGSTVTVKASYAIRDVSCAGCIEQIQVGLNTASAPKKCIYDAIPGATYKTGTAKFTLKAPAKPGSYFVAFDKSAEFSCTTASWSNGAPKANPTTWGVGETQFMAHLTVK
jgi:hypothetical protein